MNRREFIRSVALMGLGMGVGSRWLPSTAWAQVPPNDRPVLVNITLRGDPDFRHMIAPRFENDENSYGFAYWANRWRTYRIPENPGAWQNHFDNEFILVDGQGAWLAR